MKRFMLFENWKDFIWLKQPVKIINKYTPAKKKKKPLSKQKWEGKQLYEYFKRKSLPIEDLDMATKRENLEKKMKLPS